MALIENTLFGIEDKVKIAIERLRMHEPAEGYWFANSYGKDSTVCRELLKDSGVAWEGHHNRTTLDAPELMRFGRTHHPETVEHAPKERFEVTLLKKQFPPLRFQRWCCETLKEGGGEGRIVVLGVRWAESRFRKTRQIFEKCYKGKARQFLNPIIDWTTADVWEFIRSRRLPYCELYDQGFDRIGCLMCPCAGHRQRMRDSKRYPRFTRRYVKAFQKLVEFRKAKGKPFDRWETGEQLFKWWIEDHSDDDQIAEARRKEPDQVMLFG